MRVTLANKGKLQAGKGHRTGGRGRQESATGVVLDLQPPTGRPSSTHADRALHWNIHSGSGAAHRRAAHQLAGRAASMWAGLPATQFSRNSRGEGWMPWTTSDSTGKGSVCTCARVPSLARSEATADMQRSIPDLCRRSKAFLESWNSRTPGCCVPLQVCNLFQVDQHFLLSPPIRKQGCLYGIHNPRDKRPTLLHELQACGPCKAMWWGYS